MMRQQSRSSHADVPEVEGGLLWVGGRYGERWKAARNVSPKHFRDKAQRAICNLAQHSQLINYVSVNISHPDLNKKLTQGCSCYENTRRQTLPMIFRNIETFSKLQLGN